MMRSRCQPEPMPTASCPTRSFCSSPIHSELTMNTSSASRSNLSPLSPATNSGISPESASVP